MILEFMTTEDVTKGLTRTKTVIIPFGAIEEHGPHLPLCTDQLTIYEVCREVCDRIPVFVAPRVYFGVCRSTAQFAGTITVSTATLKSLAQDIVSSLRAHGFRNFILASGHAGSAHMPVLREAGEWALTQYPEINVAVLSVVDLIKPEAFKAIETRGDLHAGEIETSLVMRLAPDLVRGSAPAEFPRFPSMILARNAHAYWKTGVWGDPSKASAEKGDNLFSCMVEEMIQLVRRMEQFEE